MKLRGHLRVKMVKCTYETGETSGIDCNCKKCQEIQDLLMEKEFEGEIKIIDEETS